MPPPQPTSNEMVSALKIARCISKHPPSSSATSFCCKVRHNVRLFLVHVGRGFLYDGVPPYRVRLDGAGHTCNRTDREKAAARNHDGPGD